MFNIISRQIRANRIYVFVLVAIILLILLVIGNQLKNEFTFPDSYIYLKYTLNSFFTNSLDFNGFYYHLGYLNSIKPLSVLYVQVIEFIHISPFIVNSSLILFSSLILIKAAKVKLSVFSVLLSLPFIFNGIFIFWISKYSAEFFALLLISLIIYSIQRDKKLLTTIVLIMLIFTRTEFLLLAIPLEYLNHKNKRKFLTIAIAFLIGFLGIALLQNEINEYFKNLIIPYLALRCVFAFAYYIRKTLLKVKKYLRPLAIIAFIIILFLYLLSLTNVVVLTELTGVISSSILMFSLLFLSAFYIQSSRNNLVMLSLLGIQIIIYSYTSSDSFRYSIMMSPFILFILLNSVRKIENKDYLILLGSFVLQILFVYFSIPWVLLTNNYWINRYDYLREIPNISKYTVISSSPLISAFLGYKSGDICDYKLTTNEPLILVLDGFAMYRCKETIAGYSIERFGDPVNIEKYPYLVNIGKYISSEDTTSIYIIK